MVHEEMYLCFGKTEQLLGDLYKMIKSNPENDELKMIFENLLSIAKSQIRVNAAVSDSYFSGEIKKYSLEKAGFTHIETNKNAKGWLCVVARK